MQTARRMDFRHNGGEGWEEEGGGDEKKAVVVLPSLPFRVFTGLGWSRAYKPHNSPSGDPYPTNFQIINISVAALLRAS